MNFPMIVLLCFVCCLFSCRVTKDTRTLTEIVVMGKTYKRRSKLLEATALEIVVTDTGNTALKLEVPGCKDYVALRLNRHEVKKFKEALIACGNEPMVVTLLQYKVNGKHCYIIYHEPGKNDSYPEFDGAKEETLKTNCRTARNIAFVLYGFSLILYPLTWWVSVITIVSASLLIYLNIPLLDDELWFDSCEFIKRPKQVKGKNSDSDVVASQASIILEGISEKYQDKGKLDRDYEQHQEAHAETSRKEPPKSPGTVETATPMDMMDFDIPASSEPDTVDSPAIKVPDLPAKETNAFGTPKAVVTEPKVKPHEPAKPAESHPAQPRTVQKTDVPQTQKAESKTAPSAPAQRPKADREAALAGFNITRKVEPSKEVKKPKKPITDKRTGALKPNPGESQAKTSKPKQGATEAPTELQKKPANEKKQNPDSPKKTQPFDQSFRKRGRSSSKKAQQSNGQISFEEKTSDFIKC